MGRAKPPTTLIGTGSLSGVPAVGEDGDLAPRLASAFRRVLLSMDAKRRIGARVVRALGVLKAFSMKLPDGTELSIDVDAIRGPADSGDLSTDLSGLFVEMGEVA